MTLILNSKVYLSHNEEKATDPQNAGNSFQYLPESYIAVIFSYLNGATLFHKIALLNRKTREILPKTGLLSQIIELTMDIKLLEEELIAPQSFNYATKLVDCFQLRVWGNKVSTYLIRLFYNLVQCTATALNLSVVPFVKILWLTTKKSPFNNLLFVWPDKLP